MTPAKEIATSFVSIATGTNYEIQSGMAAV
jgi:hypothetical protein